MKISVCLLVGLLASVSAGAASDRNAQAIRMLESRMTDGQLVYAGLTPASSDCQALVVRTPDGVKFEARDLDTSFTMGFDLPESGTGALGLPNEVVSMDGGEFQWVFQIRAERKMRVFKGRTVVNRAVTIDFEGGAVTGITLVDGARSFSCR